MSRLKGPVLLKDWAAFCVQCKAPIEQGQHAFLDEGEDADDGDAYVHACCLSEYIRAAPSAGPEEA